MIAESFTYFVKSDSLETGNLIRNKKIVHFYQYPELVELRDKIRKSGINLGQPIFGFSGKKHKNCQHKKVK